MSGLLLAFVLKPAIPILICIRSVLLIIRLSFDCVETVIKKLHSLSVNEVEYNYTMFLILNQVLSERF